MFMKYRTWLVPVVILNEEGKHGAKRSKAHRQQARNKNGEDEKTGNYPVDPAGRGEFRLFRFCQFGRM